MYCMKEWIHAGIFRSDEQCAGAQCDPVTGFTMTARIKFSMHWLCTTSLVDKP